ncbi:MAG: BrnA antitoxin family protein [Desulfovibrionales bacterium]|nr:BrnA antitoxin family protein [Desulfovibrionales bacterium]
MPGSKTTVMTAEEMRSYRARGESCTDWERLRAEQDAGLEPALDADSPDATDTLREVVVQRRVGRPAGSGTKEQVAIRFDRDVLAAFRASGPGWQTRMNEALKDWLKAHTPA